MPSFETGGTTPPEFADYCQKFPDAAAVCTPRTQPLAAYEPLTPQTWAALNEVNLGVNGKGNPADKVQYPAPKRFRDPTTGKILTLTGDAAIYGPKQNEVFANPLSPHFKGPRQRGVPLGDCDDITLAKQHLLIAKHGFKPENVLFADAVSNWRDSATNHAVLLVLTDKGVLVLDNNSSEVQKLEDTSIRITAVQDRTNPQRFVELKLEGTTEGKKVGENTLTKTYSAGAQSIMKTQYASVSAPEKITVTANGWTCTPTGEHYAHHTIKLAGQTTMIIRNYHTSATVTATYHTDKQQITTRTHMQAKAADGTTLATIEYTPETQKGLTRERDNHPDIRRIIGTLKQAGVDCIPHDTDNSLPLPPQHLLEKMIPYQFTRSTNLPPIIPAR